MDAYQINVLTTGMQDKHFNTIQIILGTVKKQRTITR